MWKILDILFLKFVAYVIKLVINFVLYFPKKVKVRFNEVSNLICNLDFPKPCRDENWLTLPQLPEKFVGI